MMKEKVIEKVQKLKAKSENAEQIGSLAEAEIFAAKMQELMAKHELSMTDLEFKQSLDEEIVKNWINWKDHGYENKRSRCNWIEDLAYIVTKVHACHFFVHTGSNRISIIGHESNAEQAEYTLGILVRTCDGLAWKERSKAKSELNKSGLSKDDINEEMRGYLPSWRKGFVSAIWTKFRDQEQKMRQSTTECTAMVRVDKRKEQVLKYVDDVLKPKTAKSVSGRSGGNLRGYADGQKFGKNMNMSKGVKGSSSQPKGQLK